MHSDLAPLFVLYERARAAVGARVRADGIDRHQLAAHAVAYLRTELEAARRLLESGDERLASLYAGELARSIAGGVDLGPCENVALEDIGLALADVPAPARAVSGDDLVDLARGAAKTGDFGAAALDEEALEAARAEFRRFVAREVTPVAQRIHLADELIPLELVDRLARLGVFGLSIPEVYGGAGQGKVAMCVATEELARGSLGVGSLGTRSEIAAELVLAGGTEAQRRAWLPVIASGKVLPTAVFTEPDFGSDLAHVRTRAERQPDGSFKLYGQKTWITHATRADLMTVLARTRSDEDGHAGLSILLAKKSRASGFVDPGLSGTEIPVIGYRGMKEYELSFDGFRVDADGLLGGVEGVGFKQLMGSFETARIQTAARAVGVAQAALDEGMRYAQERRQFGRPILEFARIARKLGRAIVRVAAARELTHAAARAKDGRERCDLEAGMAKLLATRVAWEVADACVQIHGGHGYAAESVASRLLLDARVLSIFEGSSEIQAQVVARRLLEAE